MQLYPDHLTVSIQTAAKGKFKYQRFFERMKKKNQTISNHFHENFREIDFTKIMQNPEVFTGKLQL